MDVSAIIHRSLLNLGALAAKAGLSRSYLKHLAKPTEPRAAGADARRKLAVALRSLAVQYAADADMLDPPPAKPAATRRTPSPAPPPPDQRGSGKRP